MSDKTIIRLSADALDKLFPEGTEVQLQLQQAVLSEVAGRYIKAALSEHLKTYIDSMVKQIATTVNIDQMVAESFHYQHLSHDWRLVPKVDGRVAKAISEAVREKVTDNIHDYIAKCVDEQLAKAVEDVKAHAEYVTKYHINNETVSMAKRNAEAAWKATLQQLTQKFDQSSNAQGNEQ